MRDTPETITDPAAHTMLPVHPGRGPGWRDPIMSEVLMLAHSVPEGEFHHRYAFIWGVFEEAKRTGWTISDVLRRTPGAKPRADYSFADPDFLRRLELVCGMLARRIEIERAAMADSLRGDF